ncbi:MAG: hypothetical protein KBG47_03205 [Bacteroidia bacterium]|nr:hypothetical protein [Sphingobacteriaceae bacterium]MBK7309977.1 hypothetical protein [Sphingobacteriaceae bacterium]MBP9068487.1 hypothetical protein [Bacteroidia bacterium]
MAHFSIPSSETKTVSTNKELYEFLGNFANFKSILPEDRTENFSHDENSCSFNIKGIAPLKIVFAEKVPYTKIKYNSEGLKRFDFFLEVNFKGSENEVGECKVELSGDMNPFILKMAEAPLKALVNSMNQKLSELKL